MSTLKTELARTDRRLFLKIKLKSLATESRIIRQHENRGGPLTGELRFHRVGTVREETRLTLLAYGFLRGRSRWQIEAKAAKEPDWKRVEAMAVKYGPRTTGGWYVTPSDAKATASAFEVWKNTCAPVVAG